MEIYYASYSSPWWRLGGHGEGRQETIAFRIKKVYLDRRRLQDNISFRKIYDEFTSAVPPKN